MVQGNDQPMSSGGRYDSENPEQIRRDIEQTRASMGRTVDELEYRAHPRHIADRQASRVRARITRARTAVMGSPDYDPGGGAGSGDVRQQASESVDKAREQASEYAASARERAQQAPDRAKEAARGNPLAAGLVAFGVGAIAGSLLPSTDAEQRAANTLRDEFEEPVKEDLQSAGQQVQGRVQERAQQGMEEVKQTAQDAAETTKQDARSSAQSVSEHAKDAGQDVRQQS